MKQVLIAFIAYLTCSLAFADASSSVASESELAPTVQNREGKRISVAVGMVDPLQLGVHGFTVAGGYSLNRDTVLELNYSNRIEDRTYAPEIEQTAWVLQVKRFFWGGLYVAGGFNQTQVSYANRFVLRSDYAHRFEGSSLGANIVLGVEVQGKIFKWGFESLGYAQPLSHSISSEFLAQDSDSELRSAQAKYLEQGRMTMARLYVGASF